MSLWKKMRGRRAFTLLEIVVALFFLAVGLLCFIELNVFSQRTQMDAYYEFIGYQLAREPLEVFRAFGYRWLLFFRDHQGDFAGLPLGREYPLESWKRFDGENRDLTLRPNEAANLKRFIHLEHLDKEAPKAVKVTVSISPVEEGPVGRWLRRDPIAAAARIVEQPNEISN